MEELLKKLLEANILSEETRKELEDTCSKQLQEAINAAKEEATNVVRAELTEQWVSEKEALVEALDAKVDEVLKTELETLKADIDSFRDLEAEYADRIVEAKASMANELKNDVASLVEKLDAFLEIRLVTEMEELREDIEVLRQNEFGKKIFEAIAQEFQENFADPEGHKETISEMKTRLYDVENALEESEKKLGKMVREKKMEKVLAPLTGRSREVMEAILRNVDTDRLEEGYKTFISKVLRETEETTEKEGKKEVLADVSATQVVESKKETTKTTGVIVTGNTKEVIVTEGQENTEDKFFHLRKLAGM